MALPGPAIAGSAGTALRAGAAVTARQVTRRYGDGPTAVEALHEVSLTITESSFTAVMGPSGSGKSTLMHCLSGLDQATSGQIYLGETEITRLSDRQLTQLRREQVGFVFQAFNLLPTLTARENITLPARLAGGRPDPQSFADITSLLGIAGRLAHRPAELSGGEIQRVAVARALLTRPRVVFADEPTGNLDRRSGAELLALLRRCVADLGQTVVMVTHDPVAAAKADRVLFLADGVLAGELDHPALPAILRELDALEAEGTAR
jgi:putative ABC transport system ATP-binding protein